MKEQRYILSILLRSITKPTKYLSFREGLGAGFSFVLGLCCSSFLLLTSCSTTKLVPDDDQLFVGLTKIDYQNYEEDDHFISTQEEIEAALATAPNGALFGSSYYRTPFPYGLWIYNWAEGSSGKIKQWMNRSFGKAPVLMSQVNPALRASVARSVLRKNGYMHGDVTYTEVPQKNKKKMKIGYTVRLDTLFRVDTMEYLKFPAPMQALIDSTRNESLIKPGTPFAVANLDGERSRISRLFRNNGYYYYTPGYASYLADTFDLPYRAQLRLQLADSLPADVLKKWYIGEMRVNLRKTARETATDSMGRRFLKIFYNGKRPPIRPRVLLRDMKLRPRRAFSYDDYMESMQKINATGVFSQIDFAFTPRKNSQLSARREATLRLRRTLNSPLTQDTLDLQLNCTFDKPYDFYVETNFNNRTIGRMGPEMKIGFTKRNAFRGGERLDINLHGSYEWETGENTSGMSTYQYGADGAIEFPRIIAPFVGERNTIRRDRNGRYIRPKTFYATPWTILKASTDIINRPDYYKMHIVSGEWTYRWQPSEHSKNELSPLTVKYQYMNSHTARFDEIISQNTYLMTSMSDYFIPKMRYTYTYASTNNNHPFRWETTIEESGNVTSLLFMAKGRKWNEREKELFKTPYSQFLKIETDLTKTWPLDHNSQLVGHLNAGIMWNYGNSDSYPFSESFYVGGANSIRAFTVRSLGPGAFPGFGDRQTSYLMQNGDTKLVLNLEYRRRLFGSLYGAVFLDAGNVWTREDMTIDKPEGLDPQDEQIIDEWNAAFSDTDVRLSKLFNQLATGTGIGLRYDLDFLVIRVDWGLGLHVPYKTSKSGYFNIERFKDMHTLHLAIGYPF